MTLTFSSPVISSCHTSDLWRVENRPPSLQTATKKATTAEIGRKKWRRKQLKLNCRRGREAVGSVSVRCLESTRKKHRATGCWSTTWENMARNMIFFLIAFFHHRKTRLRIIWVENLQERKTEQVEIGRRRTAIEKEDFKMDGNRRTENLFLQPRLPFFLLAFTTFFVEISVL